MHSEQPHADPERPLEQEGPDMSKSGGFEHSCEKESDGSATTIAASKSRSKHLR